MDFAFFCVHFGYGKAEYNELTEREKLFIRKEYERATVSETTLLRDAVFNALWNVNRKKGRGFRPLWKKHTPVDTEQVKSDFAVIEEIESKEKGWVEKIYSANGWKMKKKDVNSGGK